MKYSLFDLMLKVPGLGTKDEYDDSKNNRIRFTNWINIILLFVSFINLSFEHVLFTDIEDILHTGFRIAIVCGLHLVITYFGGANIIRFVMLLDIPYFLVDNLISNKGVRLGHYLLIPIIILSMSMVVYFLFEKRSERKWIFFYLAFYLLFLMFTPGILQLMGHHEVFDISLIFSSVYTWQASIFLIFIFVHCMLFVRDAQLKRFKDEVFETTTRLEKMNREKGRILRVIGHDLKNPFSAVIFATDLMENNTLSAEELNLLTKEIKVTATKGLDNLNNLLNWTKIESNLIEFKPNTINLYNLTEELLLFLQLNAKSKEIEIANRIDQHVTLKADLNMITIVLRNLVSNAIKYTYAGGKIEIGCKEFKNRTEIFVKDNGVGIPSDKSKALFCLDDDAKFGESTNGTDKEKGTGVGLILCKRFVDKHNGKIWVESEIGNGSKFIFSIPKQKTSRLVPQKNKQQRRALLFRSRNCLCRLLMRFKS